MGSYLRATATYKDGHSGSAGADKTAHGVSDHRVQADPSNKAPAFPDQDPETDDVQKAQTRDIAENSASALPWETRSRPRTPTATTLTYTLDTTAEFSIDRSTGQIRVGAGTSLDHEGTSSYIVTVTATDPSQASDTSTVTITVTDVDEKPTIADDSDTTISYAENTDATTTR